jgi:hypothetical protein
MKRLGEGSVSSADAASVMGVDAQRGERLVSALLAEGLVSRDGSHLTLPTY